METKRKKLDKVLKNLEIIERTPYNKNRKRYLACGFVNVTIDQHKLNNHMKDFYLCHCRFFSCGVPAAAVHSNSHRYKINNIPGLRIFSQIPLYRVF